MDDTLWFYYLGFQVDETKLEKDAYKNGMYANASTGVAKRMGSKRVCCFFKQKSQLLSARLHQAEY